MPAYISTYFLAIASLNGYQPSRICQDLNTFYNLMFFKYLKNIFLMYQIHIYSNIWKLKIKVMVLVVTVVPYYK